MRSVCFTSLLALSTVCHYGCLDLKHDTELLSVTWIPVLAFALLYTGREHSCLEWSSELSCDRILLGLPNRSKVAPVLMINFCLCAIVLFKKKNICKARLVAFLYKGTIIFWGRDWRLQRNDTGRNVGQLELMVSLSLKICPNLVYKMSSV